MNLSTSSHPIKSFFTWASKFRRYMDGDADTWYEWCMLLVVLVNTISLGLETSKSVMADYSRILITTDKVCLWIFVIEIVIKIIVYNKDFLESINLRKMVNLIIR